MSRRTKLLIAAVFLVLLVIPAAFVAVTWTPHDPPHFSLVSMHPAPADDPNTLGAFVLEIENRSFMPIEVHPAVLLMPPEELARSMENMDHREDLLKFLSDPFMPPWSVLVRGHQRQRMELYLKKEPPFHLTRQGVSVEYSWRSQTRKRWEGFLDALKIRFPEWMPHSHSGDSFQRGAAAIEIPESLLSSQESPSPSR